MEPRESQDLDDVIDGVACTMTGAPLTRDLRAAVATRIASAPSWTFGWRAGLAAAAVAAVVLVALALRQPPATQPPRIAEAVTPTPATPAPVTPAAPVVSTRAEAPAPRPARVVARQTVASGVPSETVEIDPVAIVPLEERQAAVVALAEIAPIDLDPVRISALGESVE